MYVYMYVGKAAAGAIIAESCAVTATVLVAEILLRRVLFA
jgi:hypothetical protein